MLLTNLLKEVSANNAELSIVYGFGYFSLSNLLYEVTISSRLLFRNRRTADSQAPTSTIERHCCTPSSGLVNGLSRTSSTDPDYTVQRRSDSRKSVSADWVDGNEVSRSGGQEVKMAVRLASSEHDTLASRITSSRRQTSRRASRTCRNARRRHLATSSKPRHVTESPAVTSSCTHVTSSQGVTSPEISQESPAVTSSSSSQQGQCVVTSSENFAGPRGRTSCRSSHHRLESPPMTSIRIPRKLSQALCETSTCVRHHEEFPSQHTISRKTNTSDKPDYRGCIRSTSVPPPSTMPANPFSPFWNFLFKDKRTAEDDGEDHVCNTVRSPRRTWFGSSAVVTNVYLSTINKWTGAWPTAASQLATRTRIPTIDDGLAAENELLMSQIYHSYDIAARRQVYALKC